MNSMEFLGYLSAILMGLSLGVIGGGGSILTVPILIYFFKQDAILATTDSLFIVGTTALIGAAMNARRGYVDFKIGAIFAAPSFAGVFFARQVLLPWIPDSIAGPGGLVIAKSLIILISFAVLMIFASKAMINSGGSQLSRSAPVKHGIFSITLKGFLVGCATGFIGAGGGFLIIPALVLLLHMPMRVAVGTSLAIITANSLFGFTISLQNQAVGWERLLPFTSLGVTGLVLGHYLSPLIHENKLKVGFGYFVLVIGVLILVDQIFKISHSG
jgi:uncharacterized protein